MMSTAESQADIDQIKTFLHSLLTKTLDVKALEWLNAKQGQISESISSGTFFMAFSAAPRFVGKADLNWSSDELEVTNNLRNGWTPLHWSTDQVVRTVLLLSLPSNDVTSYLKTLNQVFEAADVGELVALYQSLPLLPYPQEHLLRAAEGIRSNITTVFEAVASQNPYPADYFEEAAWNQLILKAIFIGSPLDPIIGLEQRANAALAHMLTDFAHERWAAHRDVTPELWRLVGPFADSSMIEDLSKVLTARQILFQQAAALALSTCSLPEAHKLLEQYPNLLSMIESGSLTWNILSEQLLNQES